MPGATTPEDRVFEFITKQLDLKPCQQTRLKISMASAKLELQTGLGVVLDIISFTDLLDVKFGQDTAAKARSRLIDRRGEEVSEPMLDLLLNNRIPEAVLKLTTVFGTPILSWNRLDALDHLRM